MTTNFGYWRVDAGLTEQQLCRKAGVHLSDLQELEESERTAVRMDPVARQALMLALTQLTHRQFPFAKAFEEPMSEAKIRENMKQLESLRPSRARSRY